MVEPLRIRVEVRTDRALVAQERRKIENRLRFAIERTTPNYELVFPDLLEKPPGGVLTERVDA